MTITRQLAALLLLALALLPACAPVRRPWPVSRDSRVRFDGGRLRVYGAALTNQAAAHKDALDALRFYLSPMAPALQVETVMRKAKPEASPVRESGAYASVIDLDAAAVQQTLGTHYE